MKMKMRSGAARSLPRYVAIRRDLQRAIVSGRLLPGDRVPSESELVTRYGCARMTVNKALSELTAAGLIVRRRRAGTFVAIPSVEQSVLLIHDIEAEARRDKKSYRLKLTTRAARKATMADLRRLRTTPGSPILALQSIHYVAGIPFAVEDRLINLVTVPAARDIDFNTQSPGNWLLANVPWSGARHRISAVDADAQTARKLRIARGAACLVVERETWLRNAPITHVKLVYPGNRHHLLAQLSPTGSRG